MGRIGNVRTLARLEFGRALGGKRKCRFRRVSAPDRHDLRKPPPPDRDKAHKGCPVKLPIERNHFSPPWTERPHDGRHHRAPTTQREDE